MALSNVVAASYRVTLVSGANMASFAVLVCTHNRPDGLARVLDSLLPQIRGHSNRQLFVYNDGTHGPTYEAVFAKRDGEPNFTYQYGARPVGIARARTETVRRTDSDYIAFIDDDCAAPSHWLDWLEARLVRHPELDVIAGSTKPMDPKTARFVGKVQILFDLLPHPHTHADGLRSFITACLAIRRSVFLQVGGFRTDDTFAIAGEDTDLSFRLAQWRARILVDENWWVWHALAKTFGEEYRRHRRYGFANGIMATSRFANDAFGYHFEREKLSSWRLFAKHYEATRNLEKLRSEHPVRRLALRLAHAAIRVSFDRGASSAIRAHRRSRAAGRRWTQLSNPAE